MSDTPSTSVSSGFGERRLAAVVFTDVVGYSARMQRDEISTMALVATDFATMRVQCGKHGGEVLNTTGDGLLMCFSSAVQAVACALQIQTEFSRRRAALPTEQALEHRIGIHIGDVFRQATGGLAGDGVNIAARLEAKAPPGGICIRQTVHDTVKGKIPMQAVFLGPESFKNMAEPIPIWHVAPAGSAKLLPPTAPRTIPARRPQPWLAPAFVGAVLVTTVALWQPWKKSAPTGSPTPAATEAKPAAPLSEARKLVAQARALFEGDELLREDFALADDLLAKAQALDETDGEVWAARAELSRDTIFVGFDLSTARRDNLRIQAERAIKLAPDSIEAQLAYGGYLQVIGGTSAAEAVRLLQPLMERAPYHHRVYRILGFSLMALGRLDECIAMFDRSNALPGGDSVALQSKGVALFLVGRYAEAETAVAQSLALHPTARARVMETLVKLAWRGDLDGAAASLAQWPAQVALEPRGAFVASQVWLWHRQPDKAIEVLQAFTGDYINEVFFNGPKSGLLALAHEMAGRSDAARAEWENAKNTATRLLAENPAQPSLLAWKGVALARLGQIAEAESLLRQLEQTSGLRSSFWSCGASSALLRLALNRGDQIATRFDKDERSLSVKIVSTPSPQAALRLNPVFDPIRATPEFQKWMAAAPAPKAQ